MTNTKIEFDIVDLSTNVLTCDFIINGQHYCTRDNNKQVVSFEFWYDPLLTQSHTLELVVKSKLQFIDNYNDTQAAVKIKKVSFNGIDVLPMLTGTFTHNFNGFGTITQEEFSSVLGCDGVLQFKFHTPLSYWIALDYPY